MTTWIKLARMDALAKWMPTLSGEAYIAAQREWRNLYESVHLDTLIEMEVCLTSLWDSDPIDW